MRRQPQSEESRRLFDLYPADLSQRFWLIIYDNRKLAKRDFYCMFILYILICLFVECIPGRCGKGHLRGGCTSPVLSGGQWQRISFARLLYKQCDIVILDESTASMDPLAERDLYCEIKNIFRDKIIILVSHRLTSVGIADKIIFLEEGIVTGFDTHEALLRSCASYKSMMAVQQAISEGGSY